MNDLEHTSAPALHIRPSKSLVWLMIILSAVLAIISIWLIHLLRIGKPFWQGLLTTLIGTFFAIAAVIKLSTQDLVISNGYLILNNIHSNQKVHLPSLVSAEKYTTSGPTPYTRLKLIDSLDNVLTISPNDYTLQNYNNLVNVLHPYIFITRVDKNFIDLRFYGEQNVPVHKTSLWQIIRGTILYVFLPCLLMTAIIVAWAVITKQPTFH